jgi:hypothetical protein
MSGAVFQGDTQAGGRIEATRHDFAATGLVMAFCLPQESLSLQEMHPVEGVHPQVATPDRPTITFCDSVSLPINAAGYCCERIIAL